MLNIDLKIPSSRASPANQIQLADWLTDSGPETFPIRVDAAARMA